MSTRRDFLRTCAVSAVGGSGVAGLSKNEAREAKSERAMSLMEIEAFVLEEGGSMSYQSSRFVTKGSRVCTGTQYEIKACWRKSPASLRAAKEVFDMLRCAFPSGSTWVDCRMAKLVHVNTWWTLTG